MAFFGEKSVKTGIGKPAWRRVKNPETRIGANITVLNANVTAVLSDVVFPGNAEFSDGAVTFSRDAMFDAADPVVFDTGAAAVFNGKVKFADGGTFNANAGFANDVTFGTGKLIVIGTNSTLNYKDGAMRYGLCNTWGTATDAAGRRRLRDFFTRRPKISPLLYLMGCRGAGFLFSGRAAKRKPYRFCSLY
jgi:hypothetical protein